MAAPVLPPHNMNLANLAGEVNYAMLTWNPALAASQTDREAVRRISVVNACACANCQTPLPMLIYQVLQWYISVGPHNFTLTRDSGDNDLLHVAEVLEAIRRICRRNWLRRLNQQYPNRNLVSDLRGDGELVRGISRLFSTICDAPLPPDGICFSAALEIAVFAIDKTYCMVGALQPAVLFRLLQWISVCIRNEPMDAEWYMSFRNSRFHILVGQGNRLLGVILYGLAARAAHRIGYDPFVDEVVSLACGITERLFLQTFFANFPVNQPFFLGLMRLFLIPVLTLFRLLRMHRDVNANRPNTLLSIKWPCQNIQQAKSILTAMRAAMQPHPPGIQALAQELVNEVIDIFMSVPVLTARNNASQQMLDVVSNRLVQMPAHTSVSDAIDELEQANLLQFPVQNVRNYFKTCEND